MKKICITLLIVMLCLGIMVPVMAAGEAAPRLVDQAGLLSTDAQASLLSQLDTISEELGIDVVVRTVASLDGRTAQDYADDLSDYSGYAEDVVLLLVSMEDRDWHVSGTGEGADIFTTETIDEMASKFTPYLTGGEYAKGFDVYASECESTITSHRFKSHAIGIAICVGIGLVVALIATGVMKGKLKSVRFQPGANEYVKRGSLKLTHQQDIFLYRQVTRTEKPKSNGGSGTHTSSSGRSHSGSGGKF